MAGAAPAASARSSATAPGRRLATERRAARGDLGGRERAEHDLAARAAARRLHVHGLHAEEPLQRALLDVERLHARERDLDLVDRQQPRRRRIASSVEAVGRRRPADLPTTAAPTHADDAEARARAGRLGGRSRRRTPTRQDRDQRDGRLAQRLERVDRDRGRVQAAYAIVAVRASSAMRPAAGPRRRSLSSGIVWLPAAVWTATVASPSSLLEHPALGLDVLYARHRDQRPAQDERPAAQVDLVLADLPAPAPPAQFGQDRRADARARPAGPPTAASRAAGRGRGAPRRPRPARRSSRAPSGSARPSGPGREPLGGLGQVHPRKYRHERAHRVRHGRLRLRRRRAIRRLVSDGWTVRALARSNAAEAAVREAGAEPARGELNDGAALEQGARGADVAFHSAAKLGEWGDWDEFRRVNVAGHA